MAGRFKKAVIVLLTTTALSCTEKPVIVYPQVDGIIIPPDATIGVLKVKGCGSNLFHEEFKRRIEQELKLEGIKVVDIWIPEWISVKRKLASEDQEEENTIVKEMLVPNLSKVHIFLDVFISEGDDINSALTVRVNFVDAQKLEILYTLTFTGKGAEIPKKIASIIIKSDLQKEVSK